MIVLDTSAVMAVLLDEPEAEAFAAIIAREPQLLIGAPTALECDLVLRGRFGESGPAANAIFEELEVDIVDFSAAHYSHAADAYRRYGKGRHPAGLNFGDCLAYGVAKYLNAPLLFKGSDFSRTDIVAAA